MMRMMQQFDVMGRESRSVLEAKRGQPIGTRPPREIRVAGRRFLIGEITGTPSPFVKVFFSAIPPAFGTEAEFTAAQWPDEYTMFDLRRHRGDINVPRA